MKRIRRVQCLQETDDTCKECLKGCPRSESAELPTEKKYICAVHGPCVNHECSGDVLFSEKRVFSE